MTTPDINPPELPELDAVFPVSLADVDRHVRNTGVHLTAATPETSLLVQRRRDDERFDVRSLEEHLPKPLVQRGQVTIHDPADFAQLVNRLHDADHTTMYANVEPGQVVALFDDHASFGVAGWRQHRATLQLKVDADWQRWAERNGKLFGQEEFAEFLEDVAHTVVDPDAATMLEIATTFRASVNASYSGGIKRQSGDVEFAFKEETDARAGTSGTLEIPHAITVRLSPWQGTDPVDLIARFRYRLRGGQVALGFSLLRPDRARDDVFAKLLVNLRENVVEDVPLFKGAAPNEVTPHAGT